MAVYADEDAGSSTSSGGSSSATLIAPHAPSPQLGNHSYQPRPIRLSSYPLDHSDLHLKEVTTITMSSAPPPCYTSDVTSVDQPYRIKRVASRSEDAAAWGIAAPSRRNSSASWWRRLPLFGRYLPGSSRSNYRPLALGRGYDGADEYELQEDDDDDEEEEHRAEDDDEDLATCNHCGTEVSFDPSSPTEEKRLTHRHPHHSTPDTPAVGTSMQPDPMESRQMHRSTSCGSRRRGGARRRGGSSRSTIAGPAAKRGGLMELFFILIPTLAACTLSFALGVTFEVLRESIVDAKGNHRTTHRYHGHGPGGDRIGSLRGGAAGGAWRGGDPNPIWNHLQNGKATDGNEVVGGCSAMDLALAHIQPVETLRLHSHNDETRDKPLLEALSYGASSVEADVWKVDGSKTLYVGHELESLSEASTLSALYIDPLVTILESRNRGGPRPPSRHPNQIAARTASDKRGWNGVYESSPEQTLYLFLDIKSDSIATWNSVLEALEPLRKRGWLTRWENGKDYVQGPVTVIGTGDAPVEVVAPQRNRDVFIDAPVAHLTKLINGVDNEIYSYNATLSPIASGNWLTSVGYMGLLPASRGTRESIRGMSDEAHRRGILVRWWNNPAWPRFARDRAWRVMLDEGCDFLNADSLESAVDVLLDSGKPRQLQIWPTTIKT